MTKSLERLKRLAKRKGIGMAVTFVPHATDPQYRYMLVSKDGTITLGKNAQAARFALNHIKEG